MVIRPVASAHVNASHPALLRFDGGSKLKVLSLGARLNSFAKNNGSAAARSTAICFLLRSSPRWKVATALSSSRLEKSQPRDEAGAIGTFRSSGRAAPEFPGGALPADEPQHFQRTTHGQRTRFQTNYEERILLQRIGQPSATPAPLVGEANRS